MEKQKELDKTRSDEGARLLLQLLWGALCYFVAAGQMLEGLSPFGVALVAACPQGLLLPSAIGAVGGSFFPSGLALSMKYAAAALIAAISRWAFFGGKIWRYRDAWAPLLAAGSLLAPSLVVALSQGAGAFDLLLCGAEALLAAGGAYFFARSLRLLQRGDLLFQRQDLACLLVSLGIGLLSLEGFGLGGVSLGGSLGCLAVLLWAAAAGESGGALAGIGCGLALSLARFPDLSALGSLALGGLLSGVFGRLGRFAGCGAFIVSNGLCVLLSHPPREALPLLLEGAAASLLFVLIPQSWVLNLRRRTLSRLERLEEQSVKELLRGRVEEASLALGDIAQLTRDMNQQLSQMRAGSVEEVYQAAIDQVCRSCSHNVRCWQRDFGDSMNCFNHFSSVLREQGALSLEDFLYPLSSACPQKAELLAVINQRYSLFLEQEGLRHKVARVRGVVTDQFQGLSALLEGLGKELLQLSSCDRELSARLGAYIESLPLEARALTCTRDGEGRLELRFWIPEQKLPRLQPGELMEDLGSLCACSLELPQVRCRGGQAQITLRQLAEFTLDWAFSQHICDGASSCGDCCAAFQSQGAVAHLLLSDGMGSGSGAALDSSMTVQLLQKLLEAHVGYDAALKLLNSALLVKSGDESLATVDLAAVDLYSGRADFYKAGAAPSFIRRRERCSVLESVSLPVGILSAVGFEKNSVTLEDGDLLLLLSDGATTSGLDWIRHTLARFRPEEGLQSLCDDICATARLKRNDARDDDITVLAAQLRRREKGEAPPKALESRRN